MSTNKEIIERFYRAFQQKDYAAMIACYHPNIHFVDEVFNLQGKAVGAMWHMLCERGTDLQIDFSEIRVANEKGFAHWEARYTFSTTGRLVHNVIDAEFTFRDGLMYAHLDRFNFWRWSRMALGATGWILGWSEILRAKVSAMANRSLEKFISEYPTYLD